MMKRIYLAVPYTGMEQQSYEAVNAAAARIMRTGVAVFSPISQNHLIAHNHELPTDWAFWEEQDLAFLAVCDVLLVLRLPGWTHSRGVMAELEYAMRHNIPVDYIDPDPEPSV